MKVMDHIRTLDHLKPEFFLVGPQSLVKPRGTVLTFLEPKHQPPRQVGFYHVRAVFERLERRLVPGALENGKEITIIRRRNDPKLFLVLIDQTTQERRLPLFNQDAIGATKPIFVITIHRV
ncbi:MAG: hypothetical protein BWY44_00110 [Candidatus Omnitrophica bacterium ADurb.Bin292]|nr:MAG: hypothetical protein BWY44_00110 [Candidatus Omnitrophica bacterium ADurb.Bin292]